GRGGGSGRLRRNRGRRTRGGGGGGRARGGGGRPPRSHSRSGRTGSEPKMLPVTAGPYGFPPSPPCTGRNTPLVAGVRITVPVLSKLATGTRRNPCRST